jgi:hypothetical protein
LLTFGIAISLVAGWWNQRSDPMNSELTRIIATVLSLVAVGVHAAGPNADRVAAVTQTPGCVAFWDFVKREPEGQRRFTAHVPEGGRTRQWGRV